MTMNHEDPVRVDGHRNNANPIQAHEARVNITWAGQNGDLPDPVPFDATDGDVKQWIQEAVRSGSVPGIPADPTASFQDFVVDRHPPTEVRPHNLIAIRPKTAYGCNERDVRGTLCTLAAQHDCPCNFNR